MKITLDTTILVRAFDNTGGLARALLFTILESDHTLILSNEILAETSRVLRYPRMRTRHGMPEDRIYEYVMLLRSVATVVRLDAMLIAPIRDLNDVVVMQTAMIGGSEILCTTDEDFLQPPAFGFLQALGIQVVSDVRLMWLLRP